MHQPSHFFSLGKVHAKKDGLLAALRHNKRQLKPTEHIDSEKSGLNYALAGLDTPEDIDQHVSVALLKAGIKKLRSNAVIAVEIVFSLPAEWMSRDHSEFFNDCSEWTKTSFAGELISFDVHLDEAAPHAHALILPLAANKMQGSDMVGGIGNLNHLRNLFFSHVGRHYGLSKGRKKMNASERNLLAKDVLLALKSDACMKSIVWSEIKSLIEAHPESFAEALSIEPVTRTDGRSVVQIMTSKGKGKNYEPYIGN